MVEQRLLRLVETEQQLEFSRGVGGHPIGFLAIGRLWAEIDVDRAVGILLDARGRADLGWRLAGFDDRQRFGGSDDSQ